jgi:hypothetical protein
VDLAAGSNKLGFIARFQGLGEHGVGVAFVDNHDALVASARCDGEAAGLIAADVSSDFDDLHAHLVGASVGFGGSFGKVGGPSDRLG